MFCDLLQLNLPRNDLIVILPLHHLSLLQVFALANGVSSFLCPRWWRYPCHRPFPHHCIHSFDMFLPAITVTHWSVSRLSASLYLASGISTTYWRTSDNSMLKITLKQLGLRESTFKLDLSPNENFSDCFKYDLSWVIKPFRPSVLTLVGSKLHSFILDIPFNDHWNLRVGKHLRGLTWPNCKPLL